MSTSQGHSSDVLQKMHARRDYSNVFDGRYIGASVLTLVYMVLPVQQIIDKNVLFSAFATEAPLPTSCRPLSKLFYSCCTLLVSCAVSPRRPDSWCDILGSPLFAIAIGRFNPISAGLKEQDTRESYAAHQVGRGECQGGFFSYIGKCCCRRRKGLGKIS